jgi:hypothetical protein
MPFEGRSNAVRMPFECSSNVVLECCLSVVPMPLECRSSAAD